MISVLLGSFRSWGSWWESRSHSGSRGPELPPIPTLGPSGMYLLVSPGGGEESGWIRLNICLCVKSLQSCPTLTLWDCSPPDSSVHGILQARILEGVAMPSCRGPSPPRDRTQVSYASCVGRRVLYRWATREAHDEPLAGDKSCGGVQVQWIGAELGSEPVSNTFLSEEDVKVGLLCPSLRLHIWEWGSDKNFQGLQRGLKIIF